ncbi:unnamed protein product [Caenorhabditis angaria]|uniref:Exportin-4 n=1 Tax=Caenorhabditis angaria TaxID=860376 RepID=A0A9P1IQ43_9PELO|nr:unnamed protein product [Caenorhabditis angaria]
MNCLIQLASLTGDCMPVSDQQKCIKYVSMYLSNLLELFQQGPSPTETNHFCMIINRLFLYRPLVSIMKQEAELRNRFFGFLKDYTIHLTGQAMQKAIGQAEHDDHASLVLLYDALVVLLRGRWRTSFENQEEADLIDNELIKWPTLMIINAFMVNVLASPQGNRPNSLDEDEGDETEDRILFNDLFTPLSSMICYSIPEYLEMMTINLRKSLNEFTQMATGASDSSRLPSWQEDQHWLMLILANSVVGEEVDGACHVAGDVYDNTHHLFQEGRSFCPQKKMQFLQICMENPTSDRAQFSQEIDPFIQLLGELLAWSAIEHEISTNPVSREMTSPELARSTFFALKRFLNAASSVTEYEKWNCYQGLPENGLPLIPDDEEFSKILVRFVVNKVLSVLLNYGGEERLCQDAIDCLLGLVESRAAAIATSPELFEYLKSLDISKLPNRANLMKALVLIGAAANDLDLQENMFKMILVPLSDQFMAACQLESSTAIDSQIVDYLQCFDGVAMGSQSHSAAVLFNFLYNIICQCVPLMRTRSHNEIVVSSILQLLFDVTTKVSIYIDNEEESNRLYATLLQIIDCYRADQMKRFSGMQIDDEDKASDLVLFIEILSNILSKDFLALGDANCSTGAKVVIASLEMLLTIMNEKMLQMPEVAIKFFRLILYLVEYSPEALTEVSDVLMSSLCECMKLGMTGQFGLEITSTSLESLTEIVFHFGGEKNKPRCTVNLAQQFRAMLPTVFETCLENTCETSIYSEACAALYSIIAFEKGFFDEYVGDLLSKKSNEAAKQVLQEAFTDLMKEPPIPGFRRGRIQFRAKMEVFLNKIQGLLSYC